MEEKRKKTKNRGVNYWFGISNRILTEFGGIVSQDTLRQILKEQDVKEGFCFNKTYLSTLEKRFFEIFKGQINLESVKRTTGDEKRRGSNKQFLLELKISTPEQLMQIVEFAMKEVGSRMGHKKKGTDVEVVVEEAKPKQKKTKEERQKYCSGIVTVATPTEFDRIIRDAVLIIAKRIESKEKCSRDSAIKKAKIALKRPSEGFIKNLFKILSKAKKSASWAVEKSYVEEIIGRGVTTTEVMRWQEKMIPWKIDLHIKVKKDTYHSPWTCYFQTSPEKLLDQLAKLAKILYKDICLEEVKVDDKNDTSKLIISTTEEAATDKEEKVVAKETPKKVKDVVENNTSQKLKYIVLIIAGYLKKCGRRSVDAIEIASILMGNHYHRVKCSGEDIKKIAKSLPQYFSVGLQGSIQFSDYRNSEKIWQEIDSQCNPKYEKKTTVWAINSGLTLKEIQEYFPDSFQIRKDVTAGSSIIAIVGDQSIDSFIKLSELTEKFRSTDFLIDSENSGLEDQLKQERRYLKDLLRGHMLSRAKVTDIQTKTTDKDKIIFQIEEGYF